MNMMLDKPRVTIVTPVYNQVEYIEATIESVLTQTYGDVEYIIVDDGSTDGTKDVLKRYEKLCRVIYQENSGQSAALNRGWCMSLGDILGYISADDILKPDCIEKSVSVFRNSDTVVSYCDYDLIDASGNYIRDVKAEDFSVKRLVEDLVCQPGPGAFFTKKAYEEVGGWREDLKHIPDYEFWLRLSKLGDFVRVPESLAEFRVHELSGSVKSVTVSRSDEIVNEIGSYFDSESSKYDRKKALANAYAMSARSHFQSLRFLAGLKSMIKCFGLRPKYLASPSKYRFMLSGLIRRTYYRFRHTIRGSENGG